MNKFIIFFVILAVAYTTAAPSAERENLRKLPALYHQEIHDEFNQYHIRYVTAEGTVVSERGHLVPTADGLDYVMAVDGEVSFIGDDGKEYVTKYTAGSDGYKASGAHLPVAPTPEPVPEAKL